MEDEITWTDWLNEERLKETGEFWIHRNYYHILNKQYYFSPYKKDNKKTDLPTKEEKHQHKYIGDTPPIAKGITAYFAWDHGSKLCLKYRLERNLDFDIVSHYKFYLNHFLQIKERENNRLPFPISEDTLRREFMRAHYENEKTNLDGSLNYFKECSNNSDLKLKEGLKKFTEGYLQWLNNSFLDQSNDKKVPIRQIALLCFYQNTTINRQNCDKIARKYGHKSGEKLFQLYSRYSKRTNRIGDEGTTIKNKNKIELFEAVIQALPIDSSEKQQAQDELNTFLSKIKQDNL